MTCPVCANKHFGECHKCPHHADVLSGRFSETAWDRTPCSACRLASDDSKSGQVIVSPPEAIFGDHLIQTSRETEAVESEYMAKMCRFLASFCGLPVRTVFIVIYRMQDLIEGRKPRTFAWFGQHLRMTAQEAEKLLKDALVKVPELREMFSEKVAKNIRRKTHEFKQPKTAAPV